MPIVLVLALVLLVLTVLPLRCRPIGENLPASRSTAIGVDRRNGRTRWSFETEGAGELAVSNVSLGSLAVRSRDGDLIVLAARTGTRRWDVQLNDIAASRPVIDGRTVMVLTKDRVLRAYDLRTGRPRWQVAHAVDGHRARRRGPDLPSDFDVRDSFGITAERGVVLAVGRADSAVHAYDVRTGAGRWVSAVSDTTATVPVVANGRVFVQDRQSILRALALDTGTELWRFVIAHETIAECQARARALLASTTSTTASTTAPNPTSTTKVDPCFLELFDGASGPDDLPPPIVSGAVLADFDQLGGVSVLDAATGLRRWSARYRFIAAAPRVAGVVGSGRAVALRDAMTGAVRWNRPYGRSELLVGGDEVIAATPGHLRGVDLATGATRWMRRFDGPQATPLVATSDVVVLSQ